jgi:hypothetical protein
MKSNVSCGHGKYSIAIENNVITITYMQHPGYVKIDLHDLSKGEMQKLAIMFQNHAAEGVQPFGSEI